MSLIIECFLNIIYERDINGNKMALYFLLPFCAVTLALYKWNKVEAKTFVGDTFCYFAGSVITLAGIYGKFPF